MPDISTVERKIMEAQKPKYVPQELKGRIVKNPEKKMPTSPDLNGTLMYKGEVVRFGVWINEGPYGQYWSIKVSDPNWNKQQYPKEVKSNYPDDSDVPF